MQPWPLAMLAGWPLVRGSLYEKMLIYIYMCPHYRCIQTRKIIPKLACIMSFNDAVFMCKLLKMPLIDQNK